MQINGINGVGVRNVGKQSGFKGNVTDSFLTHSDKFTKYTINMKDAKDIAHVTNISNEKVEGKWILEFNDPEFKGFRVLVSPESKISSKNGDFSVTVSKKTQQSEIAFKGNVYGSIRHDDKVVDENMRNAYKTFFTSGLKNFVETKYVNKDLAKSIKNDYSFYVPSDGDGTRYKDMTLLQAGTTLKNGEVVPSRWVTKPASEIPVEVNGEQVKLVQGVLTNFAKTGQLEEAEFIDVPPAQGSAYAFFEGLKAGTIPTDKPLVFVWGDNFADINIQKIMKQHEDTNADFTMLALPVKKDRISALGAVHVKSEDNLEATWFMEKPQSEEDIAKAKLNDQGDYLGIVGPYILSPKVLNWIKESYTKNPETFRNSKGYDFSSTIIDTLVNKQNELGDNFNVQVYVKPEDETWSDLGKTKDFTTEMLKIKHNESAYKYLPYEYREGIKSNIDSRDNISMNAEAKATLEKISEKYGLEFKNVICYQDK